MGKKEKERWYLDRFLELLPSTPYSEVIAGERPDFVIQGQQGAVGVELTELHRAVPEGVTPVQVQEAMRERVVARAQELFCATDKAPLYASVLFSESKLIGKANVEPLARRI